MVVAQEPLAAEVGLQVLKDGGNAVDAAVAVGFALAVTHPVAGNIGGGGFMLVHPRNGKFYFLDFREAAPRLASRTMYLGADGNPTKDSLIGWRASGVPGLVKGFEAASKAWGTKKWADLLAPSIKLAREGFVVDKTFVLEPTFPNIALNKDPESTRIFLRNGNPYKVGERFQQPELAETLQRIATHGAREFYEGKTARKLSEAMKEHGGLISMEDLKGYRAIRRIPLEGDYRGFHIITSPPPSAGGIGILQMLAMLSGTNYNTDGPDSPKAVHYMAEAMRRFYADRSEYVGDPDYYHVPVRQLLSSSYIAERRSTIAPDRATPSSDVAPGQIHAQATRVSQRESGETTHFNVIDSKGNAVAVT
jgi:gamma-glutamyltranspeptidase/glutathione hydrolase